MTRTANQWRKLWENYLSAVEECCKAGSAAEELELATVHDAPVPPIEIRKPLCTDETIGAATRYKDGMRWKSIVDEEDIRIAYCADRDNGVIAAEVFRVARLSALKKHRLALAKFHAETGIDTAKARLDAAYNTLNKIEYAICQSPANCMEAIACKLGLWRHERSPFSGPNTESSVDFHDPGEIAVFKAYEDAFTATGMQKQPWAIESDGLGELSAQVWFGKLSLNGEAVKEELAA